MGDEVTVACAGCGRPVPESQLGTVWLATPLGLTTEKTHRDQGCARLAVAAHPEQPAKRVRRPMTKEEKIEARSERERA